MQADEKTVFVNVEKMSGNIQGNKNQTDATYSPGKSEKQGGQCEGNDLNKLYMKLGKAYYEGRFEEPLPELLPLFDKITRIRKKKEIYDEHRIHVCPRCGEAIEPDSIFCGECGHKLR